MNLRSISDANLLDQIKNFTQTERNMLVQILHHLREIERRRLFSDLGYKSLFDYALSELKYSEGQASRRIQAMRLLKDIPEVEVKIASGELSLSNLHQAQSFFRDIQNAEPLRIVSKSTKLDVLAKLENKSVREGQKELLKLQPQAALPKERERVVAENTTEVRFLLNDQLKAKLEEVRSLIGTSGATMSYAQLFDAMSDLSLGALKAKRFGKQRLSKVVPKNAALHATQVVTSPPVKSSNPRYISRSIKHFVWHRDGGRCTNCNGNSYLNYDHVQPVAIGGKATAENLRLLCFSCNQRASGKVFGEVYRPEAEGATQSLANNKYLKFSPYFTDKHG